MTTIMLSAGNATRPGGACKALATVGGVSMIDHWRRIHLERPIVVCRSEHSRDVPGQAVITDDCGGPAVALAAALEEVDVGPVTVVYADTWVPAVPHDDEFCGVAAAKGGRFWDVVEDGIVASCYVEEDDAALVAIGLYRFSDVPALITAVGLAITDATDGEVGMADVVNHYGLPFVPVVGWQDVGDTEAKARWRPL